MKKNIIISLFLAVCLVFWISNAGAVEQKAPNPNLKPTNVEQLKSVKPNSNIRITNLPSGGNLPAGQRVNFTVTMNQEAVGLITSIWVCLMPSQPRPDGACMVETTINNPQASNPVSLQVPQSASAGVAKLSAVGRPDIATVGYVAGPINVTITR